MSINLLLVPLVLVPYGILIARHDRPMLIVFGIIIAIMVFFTALIGRMQKRGARSAPELMGRTLTFWWMIALLLISFTTHPLVAYLFLLAGSGLALLEYFSFAVANVAKPAWVNVAKLTCLATLVPLGYFAWHLQLAWFSAIMPLVCVVVLPIFFVLRDVKDGALEQYAAITVGTLFFGFGLGHTLLLQTLSPMVLVYCFLLTELRDLLSYWIGKGLSRVSFLQTRVAANLSPNKTWGTGIISLVVIAGIAVALAPLLPTFPFGRVSNLYAALIGAAIGFFGLMGDLVFSMIKRDAGVKDSGNWLPGGTGIVDRIDSLVLTVPLTFHMIYWVYVFRS